MVFISDVIHAKIVSAKVTFHRKNIPLSTKGAVFSQIIKLHFRKEKMQIVKFFFRVRRYYRSFEEEIVSITETNNLKMLHISIKVPQLVNMTSIQPNNHHHND